MFQLYSKKAGQQEPFGGIGFISASSLDAESTLPVRDCLLKFFWYWTMLLPPRTLWVQHWRRQSVSFPLNTTSLSQSIDQRVKGTFKALYTWYSMEMTVNAMDENPDRTSWNLEGLHDWRCDCFYQKKKKNNPMNVPNNKFLLKKKKKKTVQVLCMPSQDLWQCELRKSWQRLWI